MSFFKKMKAELIQALIIYLPTKWKKMLYIASVISLTSLSLNHCKEEQNKNRQIIKKINDYFLLTYSPDSFLIPNFIRNRLWKLSQIIINPETGACINLHLCIDKQIHSESDLITISSHLSKNASPIIRYSEEKIMFRDAYSFLKQIVVAKQNILL